MKQLFEQYAAYNVWANHKIIYTIGQLDPNLWYQKIPSSFDSLYKTILHIWDAEKIQHDRTVILMHISNYHLKVMR